MKRRRDREDDELLPFKHIHIEDDKGKEEAIDPFEDMQVDASSSEGDRSDADEASGSEELFQEQLPPLYDPFNLIMFKYLSDKDLRELGV